MKHLILQYYQCDFKTLYIRQSHNVERINFIFADDMTVNRKMLAKAVKRSLGFDLICLEDGNQVIPHINNNPGRYVVILDESMPYMKGSEVAAEIKKLNLQGCDSVLKIFHYSTERNEKNNNFDKEFHKSKEQNKLIDELRIVSKIK